jgi:hypothetical protein
VSLSGLLAGVTIAANTPATFAGTLTTIAPAAAAPTFPVAGTTGAVTEYQGKYDAAANKFIFATTALVAANAANKADALLVYDNNGTAAGTMEAIVLVGTGATTDSLAAGILTIA